MNEIVKMLKVQYDDSYKMLKSIVEICPDELWRADNNGLPVWNNVVHALIGSDFWLRLDYKADFGSSFCLPEKNRRKAVSGRVVLRKRRLNDKGAGNGSF